MAPGGDQSRRAYPSQVGAIYTSVQSWHEDLVIGRRDIGWVCNEAASWDLSHALEEATVVNLQHSRNGNASLQTDASYIHGLGTKLHHALVKCHTHLLLVQTP